MASRLLWLALLVAGLGACYRRTRLSGVPATDATVDVQFARPRTLSMDTPGQATLVEDLVSARGAMAGAAGDSILVAVRTVRTRSGSRTMPTGTVLTVRSSDPELAIGIVRPTRLNSTGGLLTVCLMFLPLLAIIGGYSPSLTP